MTAFLLGLVPSIGVLVLFWIGIKAIVEADRRERAAQAAIETQARRAGAGPAPVPQPQADGPADADEGTGVAPPTA